MTLYQDKNTYVTVQYADNYVYTHYAQFHPLRVHYSVLTDDEKADYLLCAMQEIEQLPFVGRKYLVTQPLQFPRMRACPCGVSSPYYLTAFLGNPNIYDVPECVKQAQVENALGLIAREISSVSDKQFMTMQSLGAIKNTKYNKREAGEIGFGEDLTGASVKRCPLASVRAYTLLREWLGGVSVC